MDPCTFDVIVQDFWAAAQSAILAPTELALEQLVFARRDPLLDIDAEWRTWKRLFPSAWCAEVDAGHFVHLEVPATRWWSIN
ncbi:hypothetical protein AB4Y45_16310 [Paraburkholderia sp. EG287A]|uniref:hypothetical protein n=1 Tax=unclassified Paraburkholderia TaxID=2615204 RepID=UPI0034D32CD9